MRKKLIALAALAVVLMQFSSGSAHQATRTTGAIAYGRDSHGKPFALSYSQNHLTTVRRYITEDEYRSAANARSGIVPTGYGVNAFNPVVKRVRNSEKTSLNAPGIAAGVKQPPLAVATRNKGFFYSGSGLRASNNAGSTASGAALNSMGNMTFNTNVAGAGRTASSGDEISAICRGDYYGESGTFFTGKRVIHSSGQGEQTETTVNFEFEIYYCSITWQFEFRAWVAQTGEDGQQYDMLTGYLINDQQEFVDWWDLPTFCCSRQGQWGDWRSTERDWAGYGAPKYFVADGHSYWYGPYDDSYSQHSSYWVAPCCNGYWDGEAWVVG
jgi:hypothetical protein